MRLGGALHQSLVPLNSDDGHVHPSPLHTQNKTRHPCRTAMVAVICFHSCLMPHTGRVHTGRLRTIHAEQHIRVGGG